MEGAVAVWIFLFTIAGGLLVTTIKYRLIPLGFVSFIMYILLMINSYSIEIGNALPGNHPTNVLMFQTVFLCMILNIFVLIWAGYEFLYQKLRR